MPASPLITVEKLTKYYRRTIGVKELSFSIEPGEIFGFLGPNGAGKTTTIRVLLDLLRPTGGAVYIFGKAVVGNSLEIRRRCGYLPGDFSAYIHLTGNEFLHFAARMRNITPQRQEELRERFGLTERDLAQKIKHFSHGNLQKLGIIQVFFHWPELVILDEPTLGLDPLMQEAFYDLLKDYQRSGGTVFFSSHNLPEVEKVCHRVAIIRKGELVALETLENLKRKRFRKLKLTLKKPLKDLELPGAQLISRSGTEYLFLVKSDLETLLHRLAELPVSDLIFPEPELEEVFLTYYRKQNHE